MHSWIDTLKLIFRTSQRNETETPKKKQKQMSRVERVLPPARTKKKNKKHAARIKIQASSLLSRPGLPMWPLSIRASIGFSSRRSKFTLPYFPLPNGRPPYQPHCIHRKSLSPHPINQPDEILIFHPGNFHDLPGGWGPTHLQEPHLNLGG